MRDEWGLKALRRKFEMVISENEGKVDNGVPGGWGDC